jgi:hypothetical protein
MLGGALLVTSRLDNNESSHSSQPTCSSRDFSCVMSSCKLFVVKAKECTTLIYRFDDQCQQIFFLLDDLV